MADRRLTHAQLYRLIKDRLDEAGTPRWDKPQVSRVLNVAYADWLKHTVSLTLERDEQARRELGPLTITSNPLPYNAETGLDLTGLPAPGLYRTVAVRALWLNPIVNLCTRQRTLQREWRGVGPIRHDQLATVLSDPWNCPDDLDPRYSEARQQGDTETDRPVRLLVHSDTPPREVELTYVYEPATINIAANADKKTEVGYDAQLILMRRAVAMLLTPDENYPAAQAQYGELQLTT